MGVAFAGTSCKEPKARKRTVLSGYENMTVNQCPKPYHQPDSPFPFKARGDCLSTEKRWEYEVKNGFWLSLLDVKPREQLRLAFEKDRPTLNFGYVLSGNYISRIKAPGMARQGISNHAGAGGLIYLPRQEGELIIPAQTRIRVFHIHLSLQIFYELFHPDPAILPNDLKPILEGPVDRACMFRTGINPMVRSALERLVKGPLPGTPARLFYQGIALDLMAGQIARINTSPPCPSGMSTDDQARVIHARDLLTRDLVSPPCLKQLSRMTGLNMNKLQHGFYRLYGVSVFQYLHQYRMQEANRLFHETDMNVSQTAAAVGYTNFSHFSNAYKKQFGILPKKHLARIKG